MPTIKQTAGISGTILFMILFLFIYNVFDENTYRNFLLIEAVAATIIILLIFNPSTKRVKYAFLAGVASAISTFILGAFGTYVGWYLFLGGKIRILGVPLEMIILVFFMGVTSSIISEAPKLLRKLGSPFKKLFDKIEHLDKLNGFFVIILLSLFGTGLDFYSKRYGALLTAQYWTLGFTFCVWLAISFITITTYNYIKMPYEFSLIRKKKTAKN